MAKSKRQSWSKHRDSSLIASYNGYQGAHPGEARVIILGKDSNFPDPLTPSGIRGDVLDYLKHPSTFWAWGRGHHPYNTTNAKHRGASPIRYHGNIEARLPPPPFANPCTPHISFLELLWYPTVGNSGNRRARWYSRLCGSRPGSTAHFANLNSWICDESKLVLVPEGLVSLLCDLRQRSCDPIPCVDWCAIHAQTEGVTTGHFPQRFGHIVVHTHFSNAISNAEFRQIQTIIKRHIAC